MDSYIDTYIRRNYQIESNKIVLWDIDDLYSKRIEEYKKCANEIQAHIQNLLTKLKIGSNTF